MTTAEKTKDLGAAHNYRYINANNVYNAGTTAGKGSHSTTYTMTSSEKTKDLGTSHSYRYINANNVYNNGSNSAHQTTTYTMGTKASAAASTYDLGASNKYRYINATAAWNKASNVGSSVGFANGRIWNNLYAISTFGERTTHILNNSYSTYVFIVVVSEGTYRLERAFNTTTGCTITNISSAKYDSDHTGFVLCRATIPSAGSMAIYGADKCHYRVFGVK